MCATFVAGLLASGLCVVDFGAESGGIGGDFIGVAVDGLVDGGVDLVDDCVGQFCAATRQKRRKV